MNPRILGALLVGLGLIALAYFFAPTPQERNDLELAQQAQAPDPSREVVATNTSMREPISVTDSNSDGIPDWKDQFEEIENPAVVEESEAENYSLPETLTGQVGIQIFKDAIELKSKGDFYADGPAVVDNRIEEITQKAEDRLYGSRDITITPSAELTEQAELAYFNTVADIIRRNEVESRNELAILQEALDAEDPSILTELETHESYYKALRDQLLQVRVPSRYSKEHLDLINVVNALYNDIVGMQQMFEDPLTALLRIKRYQDDAAGLFYALQNYYYAIENSSVRPTTDDTSSLFIIFKPEE